MNDSLKNILTNLMFLGTTYIVKELEREKDAQTGESTLRKHFTIIMYFLFWTLTTAFVENSVQFLQSNVAMTKVVCVVAIAQMLITIQNQLLDLIDFEQYPFNFIQSWTPEKIRPSFLSYKIYSKYLAQFYFFFRLSGLKMDQNTNCAPIEDKNFMWVLFTLVGLQCAYIYVFDHAMNVINDQTTI